MIHLKIGVNDRPPYFFKDQSNRTYHGFLFDVIEWLGLRLEFTYNITAVGNDIGDSKTPDGSGKWGGAIGRLLNNEFDMVGPPTIITRKRFQVLDFVGLNDVGFTALLTPALTEKSSILSILRPFQIEVWALLLISLLLVAFFLALLALWRQGSLWRKKFRFSDFIMYLAGTLTNQGELFPSTTYRMRSRWSYQVACTGWCLMAVIIVNLYSSTLISHITARKMSEPPKGSIQVMDEGIFSYLVYDSGMGRELLLSATNGPLKKMGDILRRHPENFINDKAVAFQKVASGCCAFSDLMKDLEFRASQDYAETRKCRVTIGTPISGYGILGMLLAKGNPIRAVLNLRLLELTQTGLSDYWERKYNQRNTPCKPTKANRKKTILRRLNLFDLGSAFFILSLGCTISFAFFLVEQFTSC